MAQPLHRQIVIADLGTSLQFGLETVARVPRQP
jgi:hypothetical protein